VSFRKIFVGGMELHDGGMYRRRRLADDELSQKIDAVRRFNRFYTQRIGVLHATVLGSEFTLAEARLLFELAARDGLTAADLRRELDLDQGYVSRILRRFERRRLVRRERSKRDGRMALVTITERGRRELAPLEATAVEHVKTILGQCSESQQDRLVDAMRTIEEVLGRRPAPGGAVLLREHQPGDLGWIVARHGALYSREKGWDERFEGLVAEVVAEFARGHEPARERCWIAVKDGHRVGCVLLVRRTAHVAQLRCLLVEPNQRGAGIGKSLVDECVRFARAAGYRKVRLWTDASLASARRIYERAGFRYAGREDHGAFGRGLVGQSWELTLTTSAAG
jgi:DNA-binding MarR family transcriptional regulator/ribosomal protein S18 acetylase RimI-like enzyme